MEINWYEIIEMIMYIAVTVGVPFVVKYIKDKNKVEKMDKVLEYAEIAVLFAQQAYEQFSGETRYKHASSYLSNQAAKIGIKLTDEEVRSLIESTLKSVKYRFAEDWDKAKAE